MLISLVKLLLRINTHGSHSRDRLATFDEFANFSCLSNIDIECFNDFDF